MAISRDVPDHVIDEALADSASCRAARSRLTNYLVDRGMDPSVARFVTFELTNPRIRDAVQTIMELAPLEDG